MVLLAFILSSASSIDCLGQASAQLGEAASLRERAVMLFNEGRYAESEPLFKRTLAILEASFGPSDPYLTGTLSYLARVLSEQGRYADAEPLALRVLKIHETTLGPNHLNVANALNDLALIYKSEGRYMQADPLLKRALVIVEMNLGGNHPTVAAALNSLAGLNEAQGRYLESELLFKRSLAIVESSLARNDFKVAIALNNLALLYYHQGRYFDAEPLYKRALEIAENALGPEHPQVAGALNNLALLYESQARYAEAESLYKQSLSIKEKALGHDHPDLALSLNNLAANYQAQGRYPDAEQLYRRSLAITLKGLGSDHPIVATTVSNLAVMYDIQGRYADAELLYKGVLETRETALGPDHPDVASSLNNLAILYEHQGRYVDAESLYKRSLTIKEKTVGQDHPDVANLQSNLALLYANQGRYEDAVSLYERSLAIREKALGPYDPGVAVTLNNLAELLRTTGRYADAEPLYKRAAEIREKIFGSDHPDLANSLSNLALLYANQERYADAEFVAKRALAIQERVFGADHPDVRISLSNLAGIYEKQRRYKDAYALIQRTFSNKSSYKDPSFSIILGSQRTGILKPERAFADSFNVLQFTSSTATAEAVRKLAQRYAAGTDELAKLVRQDQDLISEANGIDHVLVAAVSKDPKQRNQIDEARRRTRLSEIGADRSKIATDLAERFPDYVGFSRPQPLTVEETQELLGDDEAVVAFDIGDKSYVWVVTKTRADWTDVPASNKQLSEQIATLRQSLTFEVDKPFDTALAYQVYLQTIGPIANRLSGKKRVSIITNGALTSIPLQLLVTSDPTGKSLKDVDWLVKSTAITVIPSIYSLKTMRVRRPESTAPKAMIAYADPVFSRSARKEVQKVAQRSMISFYSGTQIDFQALGETLDQLPSTRDEVEKVARALTVPVSDIHTGLEATESAVKGAPLDQYRIVYFATHALVAGDLKAFALAKAEPALVLSIPDRPTDQDDGLLQASEISELKLNADWVVLSACNTAASDGAGAEALSGLARAFFYAGARSLVVSHWDVLDNETALLMSELFKRSNQNKSLSHGEALQQAELNMINDAKGDEDAHPRVWAPFVVVGEPAKQR